VTDTQEEWLASTFVELADTLVADFDVVEFLTMLVALPSWTVPRWGWPWPTKADGCGCWHHRLSA